MTFGRLSRALSSEPAAQVELVENGRPTGKGRGYLFDVGPAGASGDLVAAVDVALELGRPLLVAGEPGSGKTELGFAIARRLGIGRVHLHSVKSTSDAAELFYSYDALGRFRDSQLTHPGEAARLEAARRDVGDYVEYQALGRAILDAHSRERVKQLLRGKHAGTRDGEAAKPTASVVIVDEIDKAPRDFPNDLLHEIEAMSFRVREFPADPPPETPPGDDIGPAYRPIVIVTSNEERQLPDAFLRRCVFHEIAFPTGEALQAIVRSGLRHRLARMGWRGAAEPDLGEDRTKRLVDLLVAFRERDPDKKPGIAEMLDAAALLFVSGNDDLAVVKPSIAKLRRDTTLLDDLLRR